jgi:Carboxypeptidase regulatory-like domain
MSERLKIYLVIVINVALTVSALAEPNLALRGEVKDTLGATISGAHVLLRADKAGGFGKGNVDQNLTTDANGKFEAKVGAGFYDLCIMADAFTPQCRKVFIQTKDSVQQFRLKVDPTVTKQIGDTF